MEQIHAQNCGSGSLVGGTEYPAFEEKAAVTGSHLLYAT